MSPYLAFFTKKNTAGYYLALCLLVGLGVPRDVSARGDFSNKTIHVQVVRVIDGDTLEIASGDRVRLLHINTPETGEVGANEATILSRNLVENKEVKLKFGKVAEDHYGRLLAEVSIEGKSLNEALVRAGLAHVFFIPPVKAKAIKRLVKAQVQARKEKAGIWKDDPRYGGTFHITSFHHDAPGDDRENLNGEYVRIANIGSKKGNLKGFQVVNSRREGVTLPAMSLPVGRTVKIRVGSGKSQLSASKGQQKHFMNRDKPLWSNRGDEAILLRPDGTVEDLVKSKASRYGRSPKR